MSDSEGVTEVLAPGKWVCHVEVDTSLCAFADAAAQAVRLAQVYEQVSFHHGSLTIQVFADWNEDDVQTAWRYAKMISQGKTGLVT